ncbi:2-phospho-L-lactate guanylyltransferase [Sphingobium phenoxybenzoativorans]|jgi:2-phospho-L-lactate guanylyltransferase|uniref:2-phospho-L-lactate guanylyltransferase n=1 Tax=Sphingobium phenoxybenzoativorans TaxID=1592790 RepID=A0A975K9A0_9SPHN|nr:2-phospho-L-lactate guanylyltransferase [Sphingobium phenoxybenzoativorans]QUT07178.1 2-phospho-L-lactate guanylyltransferase [Sphingobium phenoxybenzoativorans]
MMRWTAIVPLKADGQRKTRLAGMLRPEARSMLSLRMFNHVVAVLRDHPRIGRIVLLACEPTDGWDGGWLADDGRGLNEELDAARMATGHATLVVHADLPLLVVEDMDVLLWVAERHGVALAPDRHGVGTNAVAIADMRDFRFKFGPDSFRTHLKQASDYGIVRRVGLAHDVDTQEDLQFVDACGWTNDIM